jgi:hypothetical protein
VDSVPRFLSVLAGAVELDGRGEGLREDPACDGGWRFWEVERTRWGCRDGVREGEIQSSAGNGANASKTPGCGLEDEGTREWSVFSLGAAGDWENWVGKSAGVSGWAWLMGVTGLVRFLRRWFNDTSVSMLILFVNISSSLATAAPAPKDWGISPSPESAKLASMKLLVSCSDGKPRIKG